MYVTMTLVRKSAMTDTKEQTARTGTSVDRTIQIVHPWDLVRMEELAGTIPVAA